MTEQAQKTYKLSIYLIKEEFKEFEDVIKGAPEEYDVKNAEKKIIGKLYFKTISGRRPAWFALFDGNVQNDLSDKLSSRNFSVVFLLKHKKRIFATTFGYGRSLLKRETWEERFGLKVVMNSIDRDKIRVIDRKNLDTMLTQTRTQTSRICAIEEFNLDVQQILLKALMGNPKDEAFASHIAGSDSLHITCPITLESIENKFNEILRAYKSENYKEVFPWIDNICEVANKTKIEELNEKLIKKIKTGEEERLFLAVPDIVDWTNIAGFKFKEGDDEVHPDILLSNFLQTVRDIQILSCQYLKLKKVFQVNADTGTAEAKWSVYQCLNCELDDNGKTYILTEGKWYEVDSSFVAYVNGILKKVKKHNIQLAANKDEKEADYCQRLYETHKFNYALMDQKMIYHGGGHSQIEFCDLFTKDGKLIHLKRYAGSSVLSHLFTQGVNCARIFISDVEFRRKVNEKLPKSHRFDIGKMPVPKDYEIIFGIISETAEHLPDKLPFLSKITLMRAMEELEKIMGFKMSIAGIKISV